MTWVDCEVHGSRYYPAPRDNSRRHCALCPRPSKKAVREARDRNDPRGPDMVQRILAGEGLKAVGNDYGITVERVRQIVTAIDPQAVKLGVAIRREQLLVRREVKKAQALAANPRCDICWGPITSRVVRSNRKTHVCGRRCYDLRQTARYELFEDAREKQRYAVARWVIAHPEQAGAYQVRHAERVLAGTAGRYENRSGPTSPKVKAALAEVYRLRAQHEAVGA